MNFHFIKIDRLLFIFLLSIELISFPFLSSLTAAADAPTPEASLTPDINTLLMSSTFKIVGDNGNIGTVFIIGKKKPNSTERRAYTVLVTAAHILEQIPGDSATIFLRKKDGDKYEKTPFRYQIRQDGNPLWVKHPEADVAAMFIRLPKDTDIMLVTSTILSNDKLLKDYDIYPGREIKVLGYPLGMESSSAGFPILRTGSIASFPLTPSAQERTFLVDFRVFEGNSGGPVYFDDPYWYKRVSRDADITQRGILLSGPGVQLILGLVSEQVFLTETTHTYLQENKQKLPISVAKVVHGALINETMDLLPPQPVPERTSVLLRQMTFLNEALSRLQDKIPDKSLAQIKEDSANWEHIPTEKNWTIASDAVTFEAAKYNITSNLTVVSLPQSGATIKYQTVGKRYRNEVPVTAGGTTTCQETVPIGLYYIWAERGGEPTSDRNNLYHVINSQQRIEITENVRPSSPR